MKYLLYKAINGIVLDEGHIKRQELLRMVEEFKNRNDYTLAVFRTSTKDVQIAFLMQGKADCPRDQGLFIRDVIKHYPFLGNVLLSLKPVAVRHRTRETKDEPEEPSGEDQPNATVTRIKL